jgi:hypothetical protein
MFEVSQLNVAYGESHVIHVSLAVTAQMNPSRRDGAKRDRQERLLKSLNYCQRVLATFGWCEGTGPASYKRCGSRAGLCASGRMVISTVEQNI